MKLTLLLTMAVVAALASANPVAQVNNATEAITCCEVLPKPCAECDKFHDDCMKDCKCWLCDCAQICRCKTAGYLDCKKNCNWQCF